MYRDLERPPLAVDAMTAALARDGFTLRVVEETGSTNADLAAAARAGAAEGVVLVAERQREGRGRLDRYWTSPDGAGLTFSVLLRPSVPVSRLGWVPLLAGVATVAALREQAGVHAVLKWPNDVLVDGRKIAGLLAEVPGGAEAPGGTGTPAVVVGIGLNVTTRADELPPGATSLALEDATTTDRATLLPAVLRSLSRAYAGWLAEPDALRPAYQALCATLGRKVRVELPGGVAYEGTAEGIDEAGRLHVGDRAFGAGDVVHLR